MSLMLFVEIVLTSFIIPIAVYFVLVRECDENKHKGLFHFIKKLWAKNRVTLWKRRHHIDIENLTDYETPQQEDNGWDSMSFITTNTNGAVIQVSLRIFNKSIAEVILFVKTEDGTIYRLPQHPDTLVGYIADELQWSAHGLKLNVLEPYNRWRITYNGRLLNVKTNELEHVRMNFIWAAIGLPVLQPQDWDTNLISEFLASTKWTNKDWFNKFTSNEGYGYHLYGMCYGEVHTNKSVEITTRGVRVRRQSRAPYSQLDRADRHVTLFVTSPDGVHLLLEATSSVHGLEQATWGSVMFPKADIEYISKTNLQLNKFCQDKNNVGSNYKLTIQAGKSFDIELNLNKDYINKYMTGQPTHYEREIFSLPVDVKLDGRKCRGILHLEYTLKDPPPLNVILPDVKRLKWVPFESVNKSLYCVPFNHTDAGCPQLVGAKGASLALLSSVNTDQYKVPPGFCVTTKAFDQHLNENKKLSKAIDEIVNVNIDYDINVMKEKCLITEEIFRQTSISGELRESILTHVKALRKTMESEMISDDITFAVRSSAIGEDSEELSAAGQNETVLGCRTDDDIIKAIQLCWSSLFSFHSTTYRRMHGQACCPGMGVVVQGVVPARVAGVMFSRHPTNGDPKYLLITANYGLGESVVSGQVEPDTIELERDSRNNIKLHKAEIGNKTHRIVVKQNNKESNNMTTETIELSQLERERICLEESDCILLGKIAVAQELMWCAPRDIEWAIANGKVYLLQARPITSLDSMSEYELLRELDWPIMSDEELLTFANTGEVFPGTTTPLTITTTIKYLTRSTQIFTGAKVSKFISIPSGCITHYNYAFNLYNTLYLRVGKKLDATTKILDIGLSGRIIVDERIHAIALKRNPPSYSNKLSQISLLIHSILRLQFFVRQTKVLLDKYLSEPINTRNPIEILNRIEEQDWIPYKICYYHYMTTSGSMFSQIVALSILTEGAEEFTNDHYNDIALMLSSNSDVISAEVPNGLAKITKAIKESGKSKEFSELKLTECKKWLESNCPEAARLLEKFIQEQGHRNIKEFDLATKTWGIDSTSLIETLQASSRIEIDNLSSKTHFTHQQIIEKLKSPKKLATKFILRWFLPWGQKAVSAREQSKAYSIQMVHKLRLQYLALAEELQRQWYLPDKELIFYFNSYELRKFLETRDAGLMKKAQQRMKRFPTWNKQIKFAEINEGSFKPLRDDNKPISTCDGEKLVATPVCSGDVIARACVIRNLSEINQLRQGDILITHSTDIGWSPYFPLISGIVTELGGLISHGAVIAREYGLPCIIAAQGATDFCKTGDTIHLSGGGGFIQKVKTEQINYNN